MSHPVPKYTVLRGRRDPAALRVSLTAGGLIPDTSLVTAIELRGVDVRSGEAVTWSTSIVTQSASALTADHLYSEEDTATLRTIRFVIWATATGAANAIDCGVFELMVEAP